jgi:hypothetical protein
MNKLSRDCFTSESEGDLSNPFKFAVPLVEYYLRHHNEGKMSEERISYMTAICCSSISAGWGELVINNPQEVTSYLAKVIEILKTTESKTYKNLLSQPIFSVLEKIEDIPEGKELYGEICDDVVRLCQEDVELTRLSRFLSSGGEYQDCYEELDF